MSILIKGMSLPETCYECPLGDNEYYECRATKGRRMSYHHDEYGYPDGVRQDWCPLVPVPPHGDLIDRDALSKSLDKLCDRVCQYSKAQRKVMCGACPLGDAFAVVEDDAPTIIEAEEDET